MRCGHGALANGSAVGGRAAILGNAALAFFIAALLVAPTAAQTIGVVTTVVGSGTDANTDGTGTDASFAKTHFVALDSTDTNMYVTNRGTCVRKVVMATGVVTTFAGSATVSGNTEGTGTDARLGSTGGMQIASDDSVLYVADASQSVVKKIVLSTGVLTKWVGSHWGTTSQDGTGTNARIPSPVGLALTPDDAVMYVADSNNNCIRKVIQSSRAVTTLAGYCNPNVQTNRYQDATGTIAKFSNIQGLHVTSDGATLYALELGNHVIRKIVTATGVTTTFAGSTDGHGAVGTGSGYLDGTGTDARFTHPQGGEMKADDSVLYVGCRSNKVRAIDMATGVVSTLAGAGSGYVDGTGTNALFNTMWGMDLSADESQLYIADFHNKRVRRLQVALPPAPTAAPTLPPYTAPAATLQCGWTRLPAGTSFDPTSDCTASGAYTTAVSSRMGSTTVGEVDGWYLVTYTTTDGQEARRSCLSDTSNCEHNIVCHPCQSKPLTCT